MEQRADLEGRQAKCLIASEGHLWMRNYFDRFPSVGRSPKLRSQSSHIHPPKPTPLSGQPPPADPP